MYLLANVYVPGHRLKLRNICYSSICSTFDMRHNYRNLYFQLCKLCRVQAITFHMHLYTRKHTSEKQGVRVPFSRWLRLEYMQMPLDTFCIFLQTARKPHLVKPFAQDSSLYYIYNIYSTRIYAPNSPSLYGRIAAFPTVFPLSRAYCLCITHTNWTMKCNATLVHTNTRLVCTCSTGCGHVNRMEVYVCARPCGILYVSNKKNYKTRAHYVLVCVFHLFYYSGMANTSSVVMCRCAVDLCACVTFFVSIVQMDRGANLKCAHLSC